MTGEARRCLNELQAAPLPDIEAAVTQLANGPLAPLEAAWVLHRTYEVDMPAAVDRILRGQTEKAHPIEMLSSLLSGLSSRGDNTVTITRRVSYHRAECNAFDCDGCARLVVSPEG